MMDCGVSDASRGADGGAGGRVQGDDRSEPELAEHFYVVLDGRILVAGGRKPPGSSFTVDLYRNLRDFRDGKVMEPGVSPCLDRLLPPL